MYLDNELLDTEWGYPGSEARIDVSDRVAFSAYTVLEKDTELFRTNVTLTNVGQGELRFLYRGCPVQVQVFRDEAREGEPLFDSFGDPGHSCPPQEILRSLFAREDFRFTLLFRPQDVLSDSVSHGQYYVTAIVRPNGIRMNVPAGEIEL